MNLEGNLKTNYGKILEDVLVLTLFTSVAIGMVYSLGYAYVRYFGEIAEKFYSYFPH